MVVHVDMPVWLAACAMVIVAYYVDHICTRRKP